MSWPAKDKTFFIIDLLTQMYANITEHNLYRYSDFGSQKFPYEGMGPNFETLVAQVEKTYALCNATIVQTAAFPTNAQKTAMTEVLKWGAGSDLSEGKHSLVMNVAKAFLNSSFVHCFSDNIDKDWVTVEETTSSWAYAIPLIVIAMAIALAGWSLYCFARHKSSNNSESNTETSSLTNPTTVEETPSHDKTGIRLRMTA